MRIFLDQLVMHAGNIVERHPSPQQLCHDTMFLFGIFIDVEEILARQSAVLSGHVALVLTYPNGSDVLA